MAWVQSLVRKWRSPKPCGTAEKKKRQEISVGDKVVKREPLRTVNGNVNWSSNCAKWHGCFPKIKNRTTIRTSNSTSAYLSEESKNCNLKRYMHLYVHWGIIYSSWDMVATYVTIYGWMKKLCYMYVCTHINKHNRVLLSHNEEWDLNHLWQHTWTSRGLQQVK